MLPLDAQKFPAAPSHNGIPDRLGASCSIRLGAAPIPADRRPHTLVAQDGAQTPPLSGRMTDPDRGQRLFRRRLQFRALRSQSDDRAGGYRHAVWDAALPLFAIGVLQAPDNEKESGQHSPKDEGGRKQPHKTLEVHPQAERGEKLHISAAEDPRGERERANRQNRGEHADILSKAGGKPFHRHGD